MDRAYGAVEDYEPAELVVALGDLDLVCKELNHQHQIAVQKTEDSKPLGLTLLTLNQGTVAAAGALLRQDGGLVSRAIQAKWPNGQPGGAKLSDLDLILSKLRADFGSRYAGWIPEIGKNRLISPVRGLPYVSGCTQGDPSQLGFDDPNPQLASGQGLGWPQPRPTEPGHGMRVGLLDTKLYQNPWLTGGYLASAEDLIKDPAPGDPFPALEGHGTFIAGLILRQAPGARLIVRPVMGDRALGRTWGVAKMMAEFVGTGVDVLNLSFGCYTDDGQPPLVLAKAVSLVSPQILLVAAAGNHGNIEALRAAKSPLAAPWTANLQDTTPVWPAAFAEVTAVGANDGHGKVADFSPKAPWVDVTAPGVDVESTYLDGDVRLTSKDTQPQIQLFAGFARWQGTSFAAATVSGAVAASIGPGRDARQALNAVLTDSARYPEISPYEAP